MTNVRNLMMRHPRFVSFRRGETIDIMDPFKQLQASPSSPKKNFFGVARRRYDAKRGLTTTPPPRASPTSSPSPSPSPTNRTHATHGTVDDVTINGSNGSHVNGINGMADEEKKRQSLDMNDIKTLSSDDDDYDPPNILNDFTDATCYDALLRRRKRRETRARIKSEREASWHNESVNWQPNTFLALCDVNDLSSLDPFTHIYMFDVGMYVIISCVTCVIYFILYIYPHVA
jgi:hypothetical protein